MIGADAEEIIIANQTRSKSENKEKRVEYWSRSIENDNPEQSHIDIFKYIEL